MFLFFEILSKNSHEHFTLNIPIIKPINLNHILMLKKITLKFLYICIRIAITNVIVMDSIFWLNIEF